MPANHLSRKQRPLIYACSGCSDVAQLANNAAVRLDHAGDYEMSCISGVGGQVGPLLKTARSGRPVTVLDGCALHCASACLANAGVTPARHIRLYDYGFKKQYGQSYGDDAIEAVCQLVLTGNLGVDARNRTQIETNGRDTDD